MVTHHGSRSSTDRPTSAVPMSALSATGSANLPTSVTSPRRRARSPSSRSVTEASTKIAQATIRQVVSCPPSWKRATAKTGTSSRRSRVSPLATLATLAVCGGVAAGSGATGLTAGSPPPGGDGRGGDRVDRRPVRGGQVDAGAAGDGRAHEVAGPRAGGQAGDGGAPVHLRCLVSRAAFTGSGGRRLQQHVDGLSDPLLGSLRHQLLDQGPDTGRPAVDDLPPQLARVRRSLGAVLVGVAEDPDRVEPGGGQEAAELADVPAGLTGEADDDVGPDARSGRCSTRLRQ